MTTDNAKAIDAISPDTSRRSEVRPARTKVHDNRKFPFIWTLMIAGTVCAGAWWGIFAVLGALLK